MAIGYREKVDIQMQIVAWHAANVMNVHLKRPVSVKKLLGKQKNMMPVDREEELKKLRKALAERRDSTNGRANNRISTS